MRTVRESHDMKFALPRRMQAERFLTVTLM